MALLTTAATLFLLGATAAWIGSNVLSRLAGLATAMLGAVCALAVLRAPQLAMLAGVGAGFAYLVVAIAIAARLQEEYASLEAEAIEAADRDDEPTERSRGG
jgi:hypothetical protein